jgi:PAS domain S-box-containing protein
MNREDFHFGAIFNHSLDSLIMLNRQFLVEEFNASARHFTSRILKKRLKKGLSIINLFPAEDQDDIRELLEKSFQGKSIVSDSLSIVKDPMEEEHWYMYQSFPVAGQDAIERIWFILIDVTNRKQAIDQIALQERRFRALIKNSSDIILIVDEDGKINFATMSVENVLQYKVNELSRKPLVEIVQEKEQAKFKKFFTNIAKTANKKLDFQLLLKGKNGMDYIFDVLMTNMLQNQAIKGVVLNCRDITERFLIQEKLNHINRQSELILEVAAEGIFGIDPQGNVIFANIAASKILNLQRRNIEGRHFRDILLPLDEELEPVPEETWPFFKALVSGKDQFVSQARFKRRDGTFFWADYKVTALKQKKKTILAVMTITDITLRKKSEEELKIAKEVAESASVAKGQFLANMSHEIRTPLNSILGFIELISMTKLNPTQEEHIKVIQDSAESLLDIINDILDFSKIEKGKMIITEGEFEPSKEFESTLDLFAVKAHEKNQKFFSFIDPDLPAGLLGDVLRLKQVLNNLLGNAIKFTPEYGTIAMEIRVREKTREKTLVRFSVTDTGIGIPEDKQSLIFETFTQSDSSISRNFGGTGLGLAICKSLIYLMGGALQVASQFGRGSQFYFELWLPRVPPRVLVEKTFNTSNLRLAVLAENDNQGTQLGLFIDYLKALNWHLEFFQDPEKIFQNQEMDIIVISANILSSPQLAQYRTNKEAAPVLAISEKFSFSGPEASFENADKIIYPPLYLSKFEKEIFELMQKTRFEVRYRDKVTKEPEILYSGKALLAEDNLNNQKLAYIILYNLGISVDIANNGEEALALFHENKYDVIFMDIHMPVLDGFEAAKKILELEKTAGLAHTPIIMLTANILKETKEMIIKSGIDGYMTKPVRREDFKKNIMIHAKGIKVQDAAIYQRKDVPYQDRSIEDLAEILGIDSESLLDFISDYLERAQGRIPELENAIASANFAVISSISHQLKGGAANYRFEELASVLAIMEENAQGKRQAPYAQRLSEVKSILMKLNELYRKK